MVYTKPVHTNNSGSTNNKRKKHLNIGNTDKFNNYQSILSSDISDMVPVMFSNIKKVVKDVEKRINRGEEITQIYRYDKNMSSDILAEKYVIELIEMNVPFIYHIMIRDEKKRSSLLANFGVSDKILDALAHSSADTEIMYTYSNKVTPSVNDVMKAHECTKVVFELPLIVPDMSAHKLVVAFEPYKTNIDEVQIDIPPLHDEEIEYGKDVNPGIVHVRKTYYFRKPDGLWYPTAQSKYITYKALKREFSDWGTYITMICRDKEEQAELDRMVKEGK